jgi:hypothetical protein
MSLQVIYLIRNLYPEYRKNMYNPVRKKQATQFYYLFWFFDGTGVWTQGLALAMHSKNNPLLKVVKGPEYIILQRMVHNDTAWCEMSLVTWKCSSKPQYDTLHTYQDGYNNNKPNQTKGKQQVLQGC